MRVDDRALRGLFRAMDRETFPEYPQHYPPPAAWLDPPDPGEVLTAWRRSLRTQEQDIVLYVHVPFCREICAFCSFLSRTPAGPDDIPGYLRALEAEIGVYAPLFRRRRVMWLCVGGGTPSILSPEQIRRLFGMLRAGFRLAPDARIAFESHPDTLDPAKLRALGRCGVRWLAIGVQSFDSEVLRRNGRRQDNARLPGLMAEARAAGISNIQLDLIAGLPHQTRGTFLRDVERAAALRPERLYLFPFQRKRRLCAHGGAREPAWLWDAYREAVGGLAEAGYELSCGRWVYRGAGGDWPYSYDQGERPAGKFYSVLGLGPGAISYARGAARYQNEPSLARYRESLAAGRPSIHRQALLSARDEMANFMILRLLHQGECAESEFASSFRRSLKSVFRKELSGLLDAGLLRRAGGKYFVTDREAALFHVRKAFFAPELLERLARGLPAPYGRMEVRADLAAPTSSGPAVLECHPTYACDARCAFCYNAAKRGGPPVERIRRELFLGRKRYGKDAVVFSGGEPTMSPELPGLIRLAKSLGYRSIGLASNGIRLRSRAYLERLRRCGLDRIELALHSPRERTHDAMLGRPGAWRAARQALRNARELKVMCRIDCVVTRLNAGSLAGLVEAFGREAGEVRFLLLRRAGGTRPFGKNMVLGWREAADALAPALERARETGCRAAIRGLPACVRPGWIRHMEDLSPGDGSAPGKRREPGRLASPLAEARIRPALCVDCVLQLACPGVDAGMVELFGEDGLAPVRKAPDPWRNPASR
ncbi:MAG: radical SAM protein [Elusimicrobiota bacterium]